MQKVVVFLDYANLNYAAKNQGIRIDHEHLLKEYLSLNSEGRFLQAAYAYVPLDPRKEHASDRAISELWTSGYVVKSKKGVISGHTYKCNFDVEIAMDVMKSVYEIKPDIVTIISGDFDFVPLVLRLREMGIYVEVASLRNSMSKQLASRSSGYICLDNYYEEFYSNDLDSDDPIQDIDISENSPTEPSAEITKSDMVDYCEDEDEEAIW